MRSSLILALLVATAAPAVADDLAITFPDPGDEMPLDQYSLAFELTAPDGATQLECALIQNGKQLWSEKISGSSTGCGPSKVELGGKARPGTATISVRAKVGTKWTKPVKQQVTLVATKAAPAPQGPCRGPKCVENRPTRVTKSLAPEVASKVGYPFPDDLQHGSAKAGSWDGVYAAGVSNYHGFISCPGQYWRDFDHDKITVNANVIEFTMPLSHAKATDDPDANPRVTAKIGADGSISGSFTLSKANEAYLRSVRWRTDDERYKFAKHVTLKITGTMGNDDVLRHDSQFSKSLHQGRRMTIQVSNKSLLTKASGSDSPDDCEFSAFAPDYISRSISDD